MSSIASHLHATTAVTASQQQQIAGSAPDSDQDPFEAMLDAIASETNAANAAAAAQQDSAPAGKPAGGTFNFAARLAQDGNSAAAAAGGGGSDAARGGVNAKTNVLNAVLAEVANAAGETSGQQGAGAATALNSDPASMPKFRGSLAASVKSRIEAILAAKNGGKSGGAASANAATTNAASTTDSTRTDTAATTANDASSRLAAALRDHLAAATTANGAIGTAATAAEAAEAQAGTKDTDTTPADGDGTSGDPGAATNTNQAQQTPTQPIAAAIALNIPSGTAPVAASAAAGSTIEGAGSTRTKPLWALVSGQTDGAASDDTGTAKTAASGGNTQTAGTQQTGSSHEAAREAARAAAQNGNAAQPNQAQADGASTPSQSNSSTAAAPAQGRIDATIAAASTTGGTTGAQNGSGTAKADLAGLPNFGFASGSAPAQPATAATAAATTSTPGTVPIAGLAVAIASRANAGANQFDIRLDPPELGRIDVRLDVDRNGQVTSHITVDRPDTLQLLQNQQPQLQQALDQAGLKTADNGLQFMLRDQSFAGQNNNGGNAAPQNSAAQLVVPDADLPAAQSAQAYNRLGLGTGLDIRV